SVAAPIARVGCAPAAPRFERRASPCGQCDTVEAGAIKRLHHLDRAVGLLLCGIAIVSRVEAQPAAARARANPDACAWTQWGQGSSHQGQMRCAAAQPPNRVLARRTIDPFAALAEAETGGSLLTHYQVPL